MKWGQFIVLLCLGIYTTGTAYGQQSGTYGHMIRVYEDNDLFNLVGGITDRGYTNGTRVDYFYIKHKPSRFLLNRIMPKAGDSSINTYGFSIMQVMITPRNILKRIPDKNDYPYSGSLFATHSLISSNPIKKYRWQTEWLLGVMGPPSLAKETQQYVHRLVGYIKPNGWDYQLKTDPLVNVSVAAEKELAHINKNFEFIGGAQAFVGTMLNGLSAYSLLRFGKMEPYFNGYLSQYSTAKESKSRGQVYFIIRPAVDWMITNALIDGGIFNRHNKIIPEQDPGSGDPPLSNMVRNRVVAKCDFGMVASWGPIGLSYTQSTMTPTVKGTGRQETSNISLYVTW
jgi:hypothetical protein